MPVVVDTSVAIKWVVTEDYTENAQALLAYFQRRNDPIYVPSLFLYEAANVLYSFVRERLFSVQECNQAIQDLFKLVYPVQPDTRMTVRAVVIADALQTKKTFDAHFLALAERMDCTLWTADSNFRRAVLKRDPTVSTAVESISDYPAQ